MADLTHYISAFGPAAILLGSAVEGQTAALVGGTMARQHLISPALAFAAAAVGSGVIDHALFVLGRSFRGTRFVRRTSKKAAFARALDLIERYPAGFILSFRFLYGLRAAGPVAIGVTRISQARFAVLNALGAGIWAAAFVGLGYMFGPALMHATRALADRAGPVVLGGCVGALVVAFAVWRWRARRTA